MKRHEHIILKIALAAAVLVLCVLTALLVKQYERIQQLGYVAARHSFWRSLHGSGPLTAAEASSTQAWMTFDYVNRVFALPPDYLKSSLNISDSRYPRLTISQYAADAGLDKDSALRKVQEAISSSASSSPAQQ